MFHPLIKKPIKLALIKLLLATLKPIRHPVIIRNLFVRNYYRLRAKDDLICKTILGNKMYINVADQGIGHELLYVSHREPFITDFVQRTLKPNDVVLDIGANIGYYVVLEASLVGPQGFIYAVEPSEENCRLLKHNIDLNGFQNVEIHNHAMGSSDGTGSLHVTTKSNRHTMFINQDVNKRSSTLEVKDVIPVKVLKADTFLQGKKTPGTVRMDVEGYETEIIKGMTDVLGNPSLKRVIMETHPHLMNRDDLHQMLKTLKKHGFEIEFFCDRRNILERQLKELIDDDSYYAGGAKHIVFKSAGA